MTLTKRMRKNPTATLRLTLDLEALRGNWLALSKYLRQLSLEPQLKRTVMGWVWKDVYPHCATRGCEIFFIAHWSELEHVAKYVSPSHVSVLHGPLNEEGSVLLKFGSGPCYKFGETGYCLEESWRGALSLDGRYWYEPSWFIT